MTDFQKIWLKKKLNPKSVNFSGLESLTTTWRTQ